MPKAAVCLCLLELVFSWPTPRQLLFTIAMASIITLLATIQRGPLPVMTRNTPRFETFGCTMDSFTGRVGSGWAEPTQGPVGLG